MEQMKMGLRRRKSSAKTNWIYFLRPRGIIATTERYHCYVREASLLRPSGIIAKNADPFKPVEGGKRRSVFHSILFGDEKVERGAFKSGFNVIVAAWKGGRFICFTITSRGVYFPKL
jgi:hypothetical protein